jgi:DNA-binding NarL/FixJ family response regulator
LYPRLDRAADCHVQAAPSHQQREDGKSVEALSPREHEVLQLMARGLQNKEIAAELVISERTVKFHVSSILGKLGAGNRTEAVTMALQQGLIEQ